MSVTVAIVTVSDSAVAGTRDDKSGPALRRECEALGWTVAGAATVPDDVAAIQSCLETWLTKANVVVTTGGTGVAARDVTPEATRLVIERELPGFGELMRAKGLEQTHFSPLSRALAGTAGQSLIINTPGSPAGAAQSLKAVAHLVPHVVQLLRGDTEHSDGAGARNSKSA